MWGTCALGPASCAGLGQHPGACSLAVVCPCLRESQCMWGLGLGRQSCSVTVGWCCCDRLPPSCPWCHHPRSCCGDIAGAAAGPGSGQKQLGGAAWESGARIWGSHRSPILILHPRQSQMRALWGEVGLRARDPQSPALATACLSARHTAQCCCLLLLAPGPSCPLKSPALAHTQW